MITLPTSDHVDTFLSQSVYGLMAATIIVLFLIFGLKSQSCTQESLPTAQSVLEAKQSGSRRRLVDTNEWVIGGIAVAYNATALSLMIYGFQKSDRADYKIIGSIGITLILLMGMACFVLNTGIDGKTKAMILTLTCTCSLTITFGATAWDKFKHGSGAVFWQWMILISILTIMTWGFSKGEKIGGGYNFLITFTVGFTATTIIFAQNLDMWNKASKSCTSVGVTLLLLVIVCCYLKHRNMPVMGDDGMPLEIVQDPCHWSTKALGVGLGLAITVLPVGIICLDGLKELSMIAFFIVFLLGLGITKLLFCEKFGNNHIFHANKPGIRGLGVIFLGATTLFGIAVAVQNTNNGVGTQSFTVGTAWIMAVSLLCIILSNWLGKRRADFNLVHPWANSHSKVIYGTTIGLSLMGGFTTLAGLGAMDWDLCGCLIGFGLSIGLPLLLWYALHAKRILGPDDILKADTLFKVGAASSLGGFILFFSVVGAAKFGGHAFPSHAVLCFVPLVCFICLLLCRLGKRSCQ